MGKLIIDGNQVFEIDEECIRQKDLNKQGTSQAKGTQPGRNSRGGQNANQRVNPQEKKPNGDRTVR